MLPVSVRLGNFIQSWHSCSARHRVFCYLRPHAMSRVLPVLTCRQTSREACRAWERQPRSSFASVAYPALWTQLPTSSCVIRRLSQPRVRELHGQAEQLLGTEYTVHQLLFCHSRLWLELRLSTFKKLQICFNLPTYLPLWRFSDCLDCRTSVLCHCCITFDSSLTRLFFSARIFLFGFEELARQVNEEHLLVPIHREQRNTLNSLGNCSHAFHECLLGTIFHSQ